MTESISSGEMASHFRFSDLTRTKHVVILADKVALGQTSASMSGSPVRIILLLLNTHTDLSFSDAV